MSVQPTPITAMPMVIVLITWDPITAPAILDIRAMESRHAQVINTYFVSWSKLNQDGLVRDVSCLSGFFT